MDVDLTAHYIELQITNSNWTREGFHSFASLRHRRNSHPKSILGISRWSIVQLWTSSTCSYQPVNRGENRDGRASTLEI
jgi:hypothetical protein